MTMTNEVIVTLDQVYTLGVIWLALGLVNTAIHCRLEDVLTLCGLIFYFTILPFIECIVAVVVGGMMYSVVHDWDFDLGYIFGNILFYTCSVLLLLTTLILGLVVFDYLSRYCKIIWRRK